MDYFGRRSSKPAQRSSPQFEERDDKKYNKIQETFLKQAKLVENMFSQLEKYEMSLRESKKCLHALTDTMSGLYEHMGPDEKEFRVAMEDHERLLEYKASSLHAINNGEVNTFIGIHGNGKRLVQERETIKREHEAATEALKRLYQMGKGSDRRVQKMEGALHNMTQRLNEITDLAMRDLPLLFTFRGNFIENTYPRIFRIYQEYCQESIKVTDVLCDIVKNLEGMYLGFDADSSKKFFSTKSNIISKFAKKYKPVDFDDDDDDDDEEEDDNPSIQDISKDNRSPTNVQKRVSTSPRRSSVERKSPKRAAPPKPSSDEPFYDAPTRLYDSNGRILI